MKPVSLKFAAFGPFIEEQFIDFSKLEKSGLFLISGDTGSGKTTILDAITIALFFESSSGTKFGGNAGEIIERMRCQQAPADKPTYVEFVFESNGKIYKFERRYALNSRGENFRAEHNCYTFDGENFIQIADKKSVTAVNAMASQVTGLTADQFRQVVILPQGKFEMLLTSDSREKEEILTGIFNAEKWDKITDIIKEKLRIENRRIEDEESQIKGILGRYGCMDTEGLAEAIKAKEAECTENEKAEKSLRKEYEKLQEEHTEIIKVCSEYRELDNRKIRMEKLSLKLQKAGDEKKSIALSEEALKLKPLSDKKSESDKKLSEEKAASAKASAALEKAEKLLDDANKAKEAHTAKKQRVDERFARVPVLEKSRSSYEAIDAEREAYNSAVRQYGTALKIQETAEKKYKESDAALAAAKDKYNSADKDLSEARKIYDANISGILASRLEEGEPCPVCGSTVHPCKAPHTEGDVNEEKLKELQEARKAAETGYETAQENAKKCKDALEKAKDAVSEKKVAQTKAESELRNAEKGMIEGIGSLKELENVIYTLKKMKADSDAEEKAVEEALAGAIKAESACKADSESADERCSTISEENRKLADEWQEKLSQSSFADEVEYTNAVITQEEIDARRKALTETETQFSEAAASFKEKAAELEGTERPDSEAHNALLNGKRAELEKAAVSLSTAKALTEEMKETLSSVSERGFKLREARDKYNSNYNFCSNIANGKGLSLKRYVLGVMLDLVIRQANSTLSNIYGGRYRLVKSGKVTNKTASGLDFEIYDLNCSSSRPAADISGGEKFLVSLSLAIGLSTVVRSQAKGANLEAIFIDEGFGTLDKDCLTDALFVLESIKSNHGMVGVISHVDELGESITAGIRAVKTAGGSICEISYE